MPQLGELWIKAWGLDPGDEYWHTNGSAVGIVFPFIDGHQIRWLKNGPMKWQTFGSPLYNVDGTDMLICEDAISARKWLQTEPDNGATCLFGVNSSKIAVPEAGASLAYVYIVWLDNDKDSVNERAAEIAKFIGTTHTHNVVLVKGGTDPKRYTKKELLNVRDQARELCRTAPSTSQPYHVLEVPQPHQRVRAGLGVERVTS